MSHWNYRVIKSTDDLGETWYQIHEAYYNDDGELALITEDPIAPAGESLEELKRVLQRMLDDLQRPVLEADKIKFAKIAGVDTERTITLDEPERKLAQ